MKTISVRPIGRSMLPFIRPGDIVYLSLERNIKIFDIVLYQKDDIYILHRVVGITKSGYIICGDNDSILEYVDKKLVFAKATDIEHNGKCIVLNNPALYLSVWCWYKLGIKRFARFMKKKLNKISE